MTTEESVETKMRDLLDEGHDLDEVVEAMLFHALQALVVERGLAFALERGMSAVDATRHVFGEGGECEARVH